MADTKRAFDLACCCVAIPIAVPLGLVISAAVRMSSPGPVLHRATRSGMNGAPFSMLKFRTMRVSQDGPRVTSADDPRITHVGRVLRRTKLDELPQLFNVLRGDMSIVGPRPEDPAYVRYFPSEYNKIHRLRPGVTSPASIRFRDEERLLHASGARDLDRVYVSEFLPAKLALDLDYVTTRTMWTDLVLIGSTIRALLPGRRYG